MIEIVCKRRHKFQCVSKNGFKKYWIQFRFKTKKTKNNQFEKITVRFFILKKIKIGKLREI